MMKWRYWRITDWLIYFAATLPFWILFRSYFEWSLLLSLIAIFPICFAVMFAQDWFYWWKFKRRLSKSPQ